MKKSNSFLLQAACALLLFASCTGNSSTGDKPPIVLGDTATIVTETDPNYTKDLVADLHPDIPTKTHKDEDEETPAAATAPADTTQNKQQAKTETPQQSATVARQQAQSAPGNGLTVTFKEISVTVPNIVVKSYRNQDAQKANGVSYQLVSGNLANNRIIINSGTVLKVSQRYQSELVVNGDDADLALDNLTTTTDWAPLPGGKNTYSIKGLETARLEAPEFTPSTLRAAVTRAARRHRLSRKHEQELLASVRNVRRAGQKPLTVALRSVMWKIDGKDASGKLFSKQVRVDLP